MPRARHLVDPLERLGGRDGLLGGARPQARRPSRMAATTERRPSSPGPPLVEKVTTRQQIRGRGTGSEGDRRTEYRAARPRAMLPPLSQFGSMTNARQTETGEEGEESESEATAVVRTTSGGLEQKEGGATRWPPRRRDSKGVSRQVCCRPCRPGREGPLSSANDSPICGC